MRELPKTVSGTDYVMLSESGTVHIESSDAMTKYGWVILAKHQVTYAVPQADHTPKFIAALEEKVDEIQHKAFCEVLGVKEKIQQLKAIEYKGES
jgi:hypothetical protein